MGKYAPFFLLSPRETGEAAVGRRRRPIRPLRAMAAARNKGERERGCAGVVPGLTSGWGGAQRWLDGNGRRREKGTAATALRLGRGNYGWGAGLWGWRATLGALL